ncbi:MAG: hypothetical protein QXN01_00585 [Candidatus Anstonellales archaeon]
MEPAYILQSYGSTTGLISVWEGLGWNAVALSAVALCIFFFTIVYVIGRSLSLENIKRWAISEMLQASASSILIVMLINLVNLAAFITIAIIIGQDTAIECGGQPITFSIDQNGLIIGNPISFAKCRIQEKINFLDKMYQRIFEQNKETEKQAAFCLSFVGIQVYCGDWFLRGDVERAHLLGSKITPLLIHLHAQYIFLDYIEKNMLSVFLPLGILLRIFQFTRGAGGLLIAVAMGFYFILPAFYVVMDPAYAHGSGDIDVTPKTEVFNACYAGFSGASVTLSTITQNVDISRSTFELFSSELATLTIGIMYYPFIAFALTLIFVRIITPLLGGELGELTSAISKVI